MDQIGKDDTQLTSEEVEALMQITPELTSVTKGAASAARPYDFRRPDTISKEHERSLGLVNNNVARHLAGALSTLLRSMTSVEVKSTTEMEYQKFNQELTDIALVAVCSLPPMDGKIMITIDPYFCLFLVDRLLGGPGLMPKEARVVTEIEITLLRQVISRVLSSLQASLENIIKIEPAIDQLETNPIFVQLLSSSTQVVVTKLDVVVRDVRGSLQVCFPYQMLKPVLPILHEHFWMRGASQGAVVAAPEIRQQLGFVPVTLSLELGETGITLKDLLELKQGDCIVLNNREQDELVVRVAGEHHLWGRLGRVASNYAVMVTRWEEGSDVS